MGEVNSSIRLKEGNPTFMSLKKPPEEKEGKDIRVKLTAAKKTEFTAAAARDHMPLSSWAKMLMQRRVNEQAAEIATGNHRVAWICPRCSRVNAPFSEQCPYCQPKEKKR